MESIVVDNWDGAKAIAPSTGKYMDVTSPVDGAVIGRVAVSAPADVEFAVAAAEAAYPAWASRTVKSRAAVMFRFHELLASHAEEIAGLVTAESGKNHGEALASIAKGNETVEYACSLPQLCQGKIEEVSRGVMCQDMREPVGIVSCVVPFNFPVMVPMWTIPIALTLGNCVILKPSEKVPLSMNRIARLMAEAGLPPGVFQMVQGTREVVEALCDHPKIPALTFVGSSPVAQAVHDRCRRHRKKVIALGGAKNHLVALPDCDAESAAHDIVSSFAGAAGQRCMAASVLIVVGDTGANASGGSVIERVVAKASALLPGTGPGQVGAIIDGGAKARILRYIKQAVDSDGADLLVDGTPWADASTAPKGTQAAAPGNQGHWVGPTVLLHKSASDAAVTDEIFGPVLSIVKVDTWEEALGIEAASPFGNAACIYTSVGAHAAYFQTKFRAGMIGVNVGIPVPREPFAFGGLYGTASKFGDMDITGEGCMEFFSNRRKITSRWPTPSATANMAAAPPGPPAEKDTANFNGNI